MKSVQLPTELQKSIIYQIIQCLESAFSFQIKNPNHYVSDDDKEIKILNDIAHSILFVMKAKMKENLKSSVKEKNKQIEILFQRLVEQKAYHQRDYVEWTTRLLIAPESFDEDRKHYKNESKEFLNTFTQEFPFGLDLNQWLELFPTASILEEKVDLEIIKERKQQRIFTQFISILNTFIKNNSTKQIVNELKTENTKEKKLIPKPTPITATLVWTTMQLDTAKAKADEKTFVIEESTSTQDTKKDKEKKRNIEDLTEENHMQFERAKTEEKIFLKETSAIKSETSHCQDSKEKEEKESNNTDDLLQANQPPLYQTLKYFKKFLYALLGFNTTHVRLPSEKYLPLKNKFDEIQNNNTTSTDYYQKEIIQLYKNIYSCLEDKKNLKNTKNKKEKIYLDRIPLFLTIFPTFQSLQSTLEYMKVKTYLGSTVKKNVKNLKSENFGDLDSSSNKINFPISGNDQNSTSSTKNKMNKKRRWVDEYDSSRKTQKYNMQSNKIRRFCGYLLGINSRLQPCLQFVPEGKKLLEIKDSQSFQISLIQTFKDMFADTVSDVNSILEALTKKISTNKQLKRRLEKMKIQAQNRHPDISFIGLSIDN